MKNNSIRGFDAKTLLGHLPRTIYLSKADPLPPYLAGRLISFADMTRRGSGKLSGNFSILFCDYSRENVSGIMNAIGRGCSYVQLPLLSQYFFSSPLESYFTGYEGMANSLMESASSVEKRKPRDKLVYSKHLLKLFEKYYIIFRNLAEQHGVKAFFLTGLVGVCEAAILKVSIDKNIRVFCCQHGTYRKIWPDRKLLKNTVFFASGSEEKKVLLKNGIKPANIFITGSPFFDSIAKYRNIRHESKANVAILTQQYVECGLIGKDEYRSLLNEIFRKIYEVPGASITIRPHPSEKHIPHYEKMLSGFGKKFAIASGAGKDALYKALTSADLVIGFESTAEIEAMMLGKPVITMDICESANDFEYKNYVMHLKKNQIGNFSPDDIKRVLFDPATRKKFRMLREEYLRKNFRQLDGRASARIANEAMKIIR